MPATATTHAAPTPHDLRIAGRIKGAPRFLPKSKDKDRR